MSRRLGLAGSTLSDLSKTDPGSADSSTRPAFNLVEDTSSSISPDLVYSHSGHGLTSDINMSLAGVGDNLKFDIPGVSVGELSDIQNTVNSNFCPPATPAENFTSSRLEGGARTSRISFNIQEEAISPFDSGGNSILKISTPVGPATPVGNFTSSELMGGNSFIADFRVNLKSITGELEFISGKVGLCNSNSIILGIGTKIIELKKCTSVIELGVLLLESHISSGTLTVLGRGRIHSTILHEFIHYSSEIISLKSIFKDIILMPTTSSTVGPSTVQEDSANFFVQATVLASTGNFAASVSGGELASALVSGFRRLSVEDVTSITKSIRNITKILIALVGIVGISSLTDKLIADITGKKLSDALYENAANTNIDGSPISYMEQLRCASDTLAESWEGEVKKSLENRSNTASRYKDKQLSDGLSTDSEEGSVELIYPLIHRKWGGQNGFLIHFFGNIFNLCL